MASWIRAPAEGSDPQPLVVPAEDDGPLKLAADAQAAIAEMPQGGDEAQQHAANASAAAFTSLPPTPVPQSASAGEPGTPHECACHAACPGRTLC